MLGADEAMRSSFSLFAHEEADQNDYATRTQIESCTTVQESDTYSETTYGNSRVGQYGFLDESMGLPEQSHQHQVLNSSMNQNHASQVTRHLCDTDVMAGRSEVNQSDGMNQQKSTYALSVSDRKMCSDAAALARRNLGITGRNLYDGARSFLAVEMHAASAIEALSSGSAIPDAMTGMNTFPESPRGAAITTVNSRNNVLDGFDLNDRNHVPGMNFSETTGVAPLSNANVHGASLKPLRPSRSPLGTGAGPTLQVAPNFGPLRASPWPLVASMMLRTPHD